MRPRAVRGQRLRDVPDQRRRSQGVAATAATLFAATVLFTWWATHVRASGMGWMHTLPTRIYAYALARGWDDPSHRSAQQRLGEHPPLEEVAILRDAALHVWSTESPRRAEPRQIAWQAASTAVPTGEPGARFVAALLEFIDVTATQQPEGIVVELRRDDRTSGEISGLMFRVDEIRLRDRPVPFTIVLDEPHLPPQEAARDTRRVWHPGAVRLLIPGESIGDVGPEAVQVIGKVAYASNLLGALNDDEIIATTRDPAGWGVPVALGPLARSARAPSHRPSVLAFVNVSMALSRPSIDGWWPDPPESDAMPGLVAVPLVTTALCGALVGALLVLSSAGAIRAWRGPIRFAPPTCRGCGTILRGKHEALPARCPECGRAIASIDECLCTVRLRRWPLALVVMIGVTSAGVWGIPRAHRWIGREVRAQLASPDQEAAWAMGQVIEEGTNILAARRPSDRGWFDTHSEYEAAAGALLDWWRGTGGVLPQTPPTPFIPDTRRFQIAEFLQQASSRDAISAEEVRPIRAWCSEAFLDWGVTPRVVRASEPIRVKMRGRGVISLATDPTSWQQPASQILATPVEPGIVDVKVNWSLANPARAGTQLVGDPLFERVLQRRVHVLPADAPMALQGTVIDEILTDVELELHVVQRGDRSAVRLSKDVWKELMARDSLERLDWIGRWEVLTSDAPDAEPCVVLRSPPPERGGLSPMPAAMGTFPSPIPETLFVRFVPELHDSAFTAPVPTPGSGFVCGETVTFRVRRVGEMNFGSRATVYRTVGSP